MEVPLKKFVKPAMFAFQLTHFAMFGLLADSFSFVTLERVRQTMLDPYCTRAIITWGLYIFNPSFHGSLYCRAVYNAERLIFHDLKAFQYIISTSTYQTSCAVNRSSSSKLFLLQNFMNIDGTTLKTFFWFLPLAVGPQKLEHKVDHNYFTV